MTERFQDDTTINMSTLDNPYLHAEAKNHLVSKPDLIRNLLMVNALVLASQQLAAYHDQEIDEGACCSPPDDDLTLVAHHSHAERIIIDALLFIAVSLRTADDVRMSDDDGGAYKDFMNKLGEDIMLSEGSNLRRACNKIIHAADIRPIYDRSHDYDNSPWYMTGEIELTGYPKDGWMHVLVVQDFVECAFVWLRLVTKP